MAADDIDHVAAMLECDEEAEVLAELWLEAFIKRHDLTQLNAALDQVRRQYRKHEKKLRKTLKQSDTIEAT